MSGVLSDVTTERWMERERQLARDVGRLAIESKSIEVDSPQNLVVRDILPAQDLDTGDNNNWQDSNNSGDEEWRQDWSSSNNAATAASSTSYNEAYKVDSTSNAEDKIIGIMGLSFLHPNVETRQFRFSMGKNGNQGVKREFNVESGETDEEGRSMFLQDVIFDAKEHGTIEHWVDSLQDGNRVVYHGYVAEAVSETIAEDSNPLNAGSGGRGRGRGR